jgi:hypothetical protein
MDAFLFGYLLGLASMFVAGALQLAPQRRRRPLMLHSECIARTMRRPWSHPTRVIVGRRPS